MANRLTPQQQEFYRENGYLVVEGVLSREEALAYRDEMHALAERLRAQRTVNATWPSIRAKNPNVHIDHCHDVQFHSAMVSRLIVDERFTGLAEGILGPNVQLHHTKMFIKPPAKGAPFPMHQDYPYFPHEKHTMMAAIFYFDDCPIEKGCFRVIPGSHKLGPLEHQSPADHYLPEDKYRLEDALPLPGKAGDVIFFNYLTIHGSGQNESSEARTTLLVQMRDPTDCPTVQTHESRGQGMMLAGIDPNARIRPVWEKE